MSTPTFCDMSVFQSLDIDWQAYKAWSSAGDGVSRVAMRSSYGVSYTDQHFAAYRASALAAGIDQIIYYHYSYPDTNYSYAEANWQKQVVGDIRPQDMLVLDFEENVPQATAEWAYEWLAQQEANYGGKLPGIYASSAYIQARLQDNRLSKFPLWLANWMYTPDERPPVPAPWTSYEFVQYSDKASIPGVPGLVDADIFLGGTTPMANTPTTISLSTPGVSQYFTANGSVWQCTNGYLIGGGILGFYQKFGGDALCGLSYLGLPVGNEQGVAGHPGVVNQEFERATVRWDPQHLLDSPPGAGDCYLIHTDQDPRTIALQSQITALKTLPASANLQAINGLVAQASTAIAQAGTAIAKIGPLSQIQ